MTDQKSDRDYCGIIFIGGGSSWCWGSTPEEAAKGTAEQCRHDWGEFFDLKGKILNVNVLDMREHDGWDADYRGIFDSTNNEPIEVMEVIEVPA